MLISMKIQLAHTFENIVALENLFSAWKEFIPGKRKRKDVQIFERFLIDNIVSLHNDLVSGRYIHGPYKSFFFQDPKRRHIHKASVRDRLLHRAIYRILYPFFDRVFIADSYSSRKEKGLHKAINRFRAVSYNVSQNNTRSCWVLQCDIRKFFASVDHRILANELASYIPDECLMKLLEVIMSSFSAKEKSRTGVPLGNLTSQIFVNIYMNIFDQWVKHCLKVKFYIRYADDFIFLSHNKEQLEHYIPEIRNFLHYRLKLKLHSKKLQIRSLASGIDFLGWVHFSDHRVLRTTTKNRMFRRLHESPTNETLQSYLGLIQHGNTYHFKKQLIHEML